MLAQLKQKKSEQGGFTLIELLIVIIILGILAAIVVFAVGTTRHDSVANSCKTNVKAIQLSAESVNTQTGSYPAGPADASTATNPLVTPQAGALLKSFPTSSDYSLRWVGGTTNDVQVFNKAHTDQTTFAPNTATADGVGAAACGTAL
jgi:general secretion pathway protein G